MPKSASFLRALALAACLTLAATMHAQMPNPYGAPITLEHAKTVAAVAMAEAQKNSWTMAVTIVDTNGDLVFFEKIDGTQLGSIDLSIDKARSAARFKRPTKTYEDAVAGGGVGMPILKVEGAMPVEGGIPLVENGKIIGAIGVSGGQSSQDGICATAAAATVH
jgi:glc operon protein GlcG